MGDSEKRIPYGDYVLIAQSLNSKNPKQFCVGRISVDESGFMFFSPGNKRRQELIQFFVKTVDDGIYEFHTENTTMNYVVEKEKDKWVIRAYSKNRSKKTRIIWERRIILQEGMKEFLSWFTRLRIWW